MFDNNVKNYIFLYLESKVFMVSICVEVELIRFVVDLLD